MVKSDIILNNISLQSPKSKIQKFKNKLIKIKKMYPKTNGIEQTVSKFEQISEICQGCSENPLISQINPLQIQLSSKESFERILMEKLRKPQGNHLLQKLVNHVADRWSEENLKSIESSQITAKMIKQSLHGETVNFGRKNNFEEEEDQLILKMIIKIGKNWKEIALKLKNKTPNMIKNRYYTYLKKKYDQKYNDMVSLTSATTCDNVKIEEELPIIKPLIRENIKKEFDTSSKMKTLGDLLRVNQMLDLEKKKVLINISQLHRSIIKEKEEKVKISELDHPKNNIHFLNYNYLNNLASNGLNGLINNQIINQGVLPQKKMENLPITHQIHNLENVIKDALKQLNTLKNVCQGV